MGLQPVKCLEHHVGGSLHPIVANPVEKVPERVGSVSAAQKQGEQTGGAGRGSVVWRRSDGGVGDASALSKHSSPLQGFPSHELPHSPDGEDEAGGEDGHVKEVCSVRRGGGGGGGGTWTCWVELKFSESQYRRSVQAAPSIQPTLLCPRMQSLVSNTIHNAPHSLTHPPPRG